MKKILIIISAITILLLATSVGAGLYMLDYSLAADSSRGDTAKAYARLYKKHPEMRQWTDSMKNCGTLRDTFIIMPNGERHHAIYMRNDSAHGKTAIVVHGYKDSAPRYLTIARMYHQQLKRNVLLPDLHGHGLSDGDDIQMGWHDRHDIIHWAGVAEELFRDTACQSAVVLHGISMGAATVMNVAGEENMPAYISHVIEDCGYTSVWDEFSLQLKEQFSLPEFPILHISNIICKMKYGWSFREASPLAQVKKSRCPILFIHGDADTFVPFSMLQPLYEAARNPKDVWVVKGAHHAEAFSSNPAEYEAKIRAFIKGTSEAEK